MWKALVWKALVWKVLVWKAVVYVASKIIQKFQLRVVIYLHVLTLVFADNRIRIKIKCRDYVVY